MPPLHIAVNGKRLVGNYTGVGRYLASLLEEWNLRVPDCRITVYLPAAPGRISNLDNARIKICVLPSLMPDSYWENVTLANAARDADVLFCPSNILPIFHRGPAVLTVHDLLQQSMPEVFPFWSGRKFHLLYSQSIRRAPRILCGSETTRHELFRYYPGIPREKVTVTGYGVDEVFRLKRTEEQLEETCRRLGVTRPFGLFVGKLSPHRNLPILVKAHDIVNSQDIEFNLVIAGSNHRGMDLRQLFGLSRRPERIRHLEFVSDDDLAGLMRAAQMFIYPSSFEGYGLPVAEAMASGCPVIAYRNAIMEEVTESAAILLDSLTPESFADAIEEMVKSPDRRAALAEKGTVRAQDFRWDLTAEKTMSALVETACRASR